MVAVSACTECLNLRVKDLDMERRVPSVGKRPLVFALNVTPPSIGHTSNSTN